jgi:hypothetical protein
LLFRQVIQAEAVALLTHGGDATSFAQTGLFKLAAKCQHLGVDGAWSTAEWRPGHPQQFLSTAHHSWWHQKCTQEGEFPGAEFNGLFSQRHLTEQQVHLKRSNGNAFLQATATPLEQGATAGCHLFETKGLAQNVIRSVIKQAHNGLSPAAGGEHDHRTAQLLTKSQRRTLLE